MAEYLVRGWNVAIPEVDIGDDIFVVRDSDGNLSRIQVKTASAQERANGYSAKFSLSLTQLTRFITPDLSYIFVVRRNHRWESFVVIDCDALKEEQELHNVGSFTKHNKLMIRFQFSDTKVTCSGRNFTHYLNNWDKWPAIQH